MPKIIELKHQRVTNKLFYLRHKLVSDSFVVFKLDAASSYGTLQEKSEWQFSKLCFRQCSNSLMAILEDLLAFFIPF